MTFQFDIDSIKNSPHEFMPEARARIQRQVDQDSCQFCHSDGSRWDNESVWGADELYDFDFESRPDFLPLVLNISKEQLMSGDSMHAWNIKYCPLCGREL
jgi:hypothetical protein